MRILSIILSCIISLSAFSQGIFIESHNNTSETRSLKDFVRLIPAEDGVSLNAMFKDGSMIYLPKDYLQSITFYSKNPTITNVKVNDITDKSATVSILCGGFLKQSVLNVTCQQVSSKTEHDSKQITSIDNTEQSITFSNLEPLTDYIVLTQLLSKEGGETIFSVETKFSTKRATKGTINGHEYVDLGLPSGTLWATCNVGASKETSKGNYYAWGETFVQTSSLFYSPYELGNYKYANGSSVTYIGSDIGGSSSYDAATKNWGAPWRMPSKEQIEELVKYCKANWTTIDGSKGMYVEGPNGNHIFLPGAGSGRYPGTSYASFWSSQSCDLYHAYSLYIQDTGNRFYLSWNTSLGAAGNERWNGYNVRPVTK